MKMLRIYPIALWKVKHVQDGTVKGNQQRTNKQEQKAFFSPLTSKVYQTTISINTALNLLDYNHKCSESKLLT